MFSAEYLVFDLFQLERKRFQCRAFVAVVPFKLGDTLFLALVFGFKKCDSLPRFGIQKLEIPQSYQSLFDVFVSQTHLDSIS